MVGGVGDVRTCNNCHMPVCVTFQTVFLQSNVEQDTLPSLFTLGSMQCLLTWLQLSASPVARCSATAGQRAQVVASGRAVGGKWHAG